MYLSIEFCVLDLDSMSFCKFDPLFYAFDHRQSAIQESSSFDSIVCIKHNKFFIYTELLEEFSDQSLLWISRYMMKITHDEIRLDIVTLPEDPDIWLRQTYRSGHNLCHHLPPRSWTTSSRHDELPLWTRVLVCLIAHDY